MNIIENWNLLNERMSNEHADLVGSLMQIHMGAFDDLRKSGHMLMVNGKPVSEIAPTIQPMERLTLAGDIGRSLLDGKSLDLFNKSFAIKHADYFPNCIFIALSAIIENLEGGLNTVYPDKKLEVVCKYDTLPKNNDPLGKILPLIEKCYPWVTLSTDVRQATPPAEKPPRFIPLHKPSLFFAADTIARIDTTRTVFSGRILRGTIKKGDVLNVVNADGKALCHEGMVLAMYAGTQEIDSAEANTHIDELCLAVEIPAGEYSGIFLVDGDKVLASLDEKQADSSTEKPENKDEKVGKKTGFWSKLFKK